MPRSEKCCVRGEPTVWLVLQRRHRMRLGRNVICGAKGLVRSESIMRDRLEVFSRGSMLPFAAVGRRTRFVDPFVMTRCYVVC